MAGSRWKPLGPPCLGPTTSLRGFLHSWFGDDSDLTREMVEQNFDDNLFRCTVYGPILRKILFFNKHTTIPVPLDTADHILKASIGNQETGTVTLSTIVHRKGFCCISEQQYSMNFLVCVNFKHCSSSGSLRHLSSKGQTASLHLFFRFVVAPRSYTAYWRTDFELLGSAERLCTEPPRGSHLRLGT